MRTQSKKVLVTGGTGFIGSHLVKKLLGAGYEVVVLSRKAFREAPILHPRLNYICGDLTDPDSLRRLPPSFDYVFHLAAVRDSLNKKRCYQINVEGTRHLISWLLEGQKRPEKIIYVSSLGACGLTNSDVPRKETDPSDPCSVYGRTKMLSEKLFTEHRDQLPYIIARPSKVYGPGDNKMLFHFRMARRGLMFSLGSRPRCLSLCYVEDLAATLIALAESKISNETYFISDGKFYSWDELYAEISRCLGVTLKKIVISEKFFYPLLPLLKLMAGFLPGFFRLEPTTFEELRWRNWICSSEKLAKDFPQIKPVGLRQGIDEMARWVAMGKRTDA